MTDEWSRRRGFIRRIFLPFSFQLQWYNLYESPVFPFRTWINKAFSEKRISSQPYQSLNRRMSNAGTCEILSVIASSYRGELQNDCTSPDNHWPWMKNARNLFVQLHIIFPSFAWCEGKVIELLAYAVRWIGTKGEGSKVTFSTWATELSLCS